MPLGGLEYGHKGFGLALGIEALSQGLSGSGRSKKPKFMNLSTFIQVIDPEAFSGLNAFKNEMSFLTEQCLKNLQQIIQKSQNAWTVCDEKRKKAIKEGIILSPETNSTLEEISKKFEIYL